MIRTIVFWGLYWGPLILGNYHFSYGLGHSWFALGLNGYVGITEKKVETTIKGSGFRAFWGFRV